MELKSLRLRDGRLLSFGISTEKEPSQTALSCHGAPGSALQMPPGIRFLFPDFRIITPERPGYGQSESARNFNLTSAADDIGQLLDYLGVGKVSLIGYSGGSAYALACAHGLEDRITDVNLFSSFAPLQVPGVTDGMCPSLLAMLDAAKKDPERLLGQLESQPLDVEQMLESFLKEMAPADQDLMADPAVRSELLEDFKRALQPGFSGYVTDLQNLSRPWGVPLEEIQVPVRLYHGGMDRNTPPAMARYLSGVLQNASLHWHEDKGHFFSYKTF